MVPSLTAQSSKWGEKQAHLNYQPWLKEGFMGEESPQLTPKGVGRFGHQEKGWEPFPTRGYSISKDIRAGAGSGMSAMRSHERCFEVAQT